MSCTNVRESGPPEGQPTQLKVLVLTMPDCSRLRPSVDSASAGAACSASRAASGNLGSPKTPSR